MSVWDWSRPVRLGGINPFVFDEKLHLPDGEWHNIAAGDELPGQYKSEK